MPPSTSSNAEPARGAPYKVASRQLAADLSAADASYGARDLGKLDASQLADVLAKLTALDPGQLQDADPYLVVTARRGRYFVRPASGRFRLSEADNPTRTALEIAAAEVPNYLEGIDPVPVTIDPVVESPVVDATNARTGLVVSLLLGSALLVGGSAYFTFRAENSVDPASDYAPITSAEQHTSLVTQFFSGLFVSGTGDGSHMLQLSADGVVKLIEYGPENEVASEQQDTFKVFLRPGAVPVARTTTIGPIESRDANTLVYAGDTYARQR